MTPIGTTAHREVARARGLVPLLVSAALVAVAVGSAGLLIHRVDEARRTTQLARVEARHAVATNFLAAYVDGLAKHEIELAETMLAGPVTQDLFDRISTENGFSAAVLLDADANLLAVSPPAVRLLGHPLPSHYEHLDNAITGTSSASNVVLSAAEGEAIIAIAVAFDTDSGRRVFSPGHRVSETPLAAFTSNAMSFVTSRALLVDSAGRIVTSSDPEVEPGATIDRWPQIAAAASGTGLYDIDGKETYSVVGAVPGTPWQLVFTVGTTELLAPVSGPGKLVPWGILAAFTAASVAALAMWRRAQHERSSRLGYERQLHDLAMSDALTGLGNRRVAVGRLEQALRRAERVGTAVAVLYIDIDKFKAINDQYGHAAGDAVLTGVADRLKTTFRVEDTLTRLGGDEFAVICEGLTDLGAVEDLATRTRAALVEPYLFGDMILPGGASVGVTTAVAGDTPEAILARADRQMYAAKSTPFRHGKRPAEVKPLTLTG